MRHDAFSSFQNTFQFADVKSLCSISGHLFHFNNKIIKQTNMDSPFACIKARQETSRNRNSFILQPCLRKQTTNQVFLELLLRVVLSNNCLPLPLKFPSEELSPLVRHGFLKLSAKLEHPQWKLTFLPLSFDYVCAKCANGRKKGSKIK